MTARTLNDVKLIGVHGPLNGGKDTVATYYMSKFQDTFSQYAFARPLKQACMVMFGFTQEQVYDEKLKEVVDPFWGFTPRSAMQKLGTEYGRDMMRKDVWVKRAEVEILKNEKGGRRTIITDVRFENEAEWLRAQPNSLLIYLETPGLSKDDDKYKHASEAGIKFVEGVDAKIINDKSKGFAALYQQLDALIS